MSAFAPNNTPTPNTPPPSLPPLHTTLHLSYLTSLSTKLSSPTSYEGALTEHLRMSGVYWTVAALSLVQSPASVDSSLKKQAIIDWVFDCYCSATGGFSGNVDHDPHLLYTLSALQILAMFDALDDCRLDREKIASYIAALQKPDGSVMGDKWGEIDTRFSYCALSALSILSLLRSPSLPRFDVDKACAYVGSCKNFDGGFGCIPGAESHAGQVFCCVGALAIGKRLDLLDAKLLAWWLSERQCDGGGLNGRPEKQSDVCYSWWILSSLKILGRVDWINGEALGDFILNCQDGVGGGIADRPDNVADAFHTFFGLSGLSLLNDRLGLMIEEGGGVEGLSGRARLIDPLYAMPVDVCERCKLGGQVMAQEGLGRYEKLEM